MNKQKHTSGPWFISNELEGMVMIFGGQREKYICRVQIHQTPRAFGMQEEDERFANARLISAAPDLLEACKFAYNEGCAGRALKNYKLLMDKLKDAITKAEANDENN
ncbi:hypothetical protein [Sulfuricurvum sp.]|uniref:hypothetical protein n=1 Tax=Sulfuricurvum sp. TaxID=2025608 RepID=UPI0035691EF4